MHPASCSILSTPKHDILSQFFFVCVNLVGGWLLGLNYIRYHSGTGRNLMVVIRGQILRLAKPERAKIR